MNEDKQKQVLTHLLLLRQLKEQAVSAEEALPACDAAMEVYGPMAEDLGLHHEQYEMLNLAVELGHPEDYQKLKRLLFDSEAMCEIVFKTFSLPICSMLDSLGLEYTFQYRMKSVYSIWRKMRVDHKEFDDVYDLFATRIVYKVPEHISTLNEGNCMEQNPEVEQVKGQTLEGLDAERLWCWKVYTVISSLYRIHPDRIKDWVSHPKPSGYQALQLTVMGPDCNWIEIQIRSERMDYEAEYGSASHALYKQEKPVK